MDFSGGVAVDNIKLENYTILDTPIFYLYSRLQLDIGSTISFVNLKANNNFLVLNN